MKRKLNLLTAFALGLAAAPIMIAAPATIETPNDLDARIVQLSKEGTTVEDVLRILGEPETYTWGDAKFKKNNLSENYILRYPKPRPRWKRLCAGWI